MERVAPRDSAELVDAISNARKTATRLLPVGSGSAFSESWPGEFVRLYLAGLDSQIDIDHTNLCVTASAGVMVGDLHRQLQSAGFLWHPVGYADADSTVGSVVSRNDGRRNLQFGTASDNLLGAEAVLANGKTVRMGGKMIKFQTGYSLHHSLAGAWGQLGVFTNLILRLHPMPRSAALLSAGSEDALDLAESLLGLPAAGVFPAGVDFRWRPKASFATAELRLVGLSESEVKTMAAKGSKTIGEHVAGRVEITVSPIPVGDVCVPGSYQPWKGPEASLWNISADPGCALRVVANLVDEAESTDFEVAGGIVDGTLALTAHPSLVERAAAPFQECGAWPIYSDPRRSRPAPNSILAFRRLKAALDPDSVFPDWTSDR